MLQHITNSSLPHQHPPKEQMYALLLDMGLGKGNVEYLGNNIMGGGGGG